MSQRLADTLNVRKRHLKKIGLIKICIDLSIQFFAKEEC